jgi:hypothetical protein
LVTPGQGNAGLGLSRFPGNKARQSLGVYQRRDEKSAHSNFYGPEGCGMRESSYAAAGRRMEAGKL